MRKIPTLFVRDEGDRRYVSAEVTPGCEWVIAGEGVATRKYDGTCVMLDDSGDWWARREVKPGKLSPPSWRHVESDTTTGKSVGWERIAQSPFAKFHAEALSHWDSPLPARKPGTYELCGPKINGNPERVTDGHALISHDDAMTVNLPDGFPLWYDTLRPVLLALGEAGIEGIVWHHPDGRMAKLKARDMRPENEAP